MKIPPVVPSPSVSYQGLQGQLRDKVSFFGNSPLIQLHILASTGLVDLGFR